MKLCLPRVLEETRAVPTLTALNALSAMWLLIFNARTRQLTDHERAELARQCKLMPTIPSRIDFNRAADEFCLMLQSCGAFESGVIKAPDRMLEYLDELRAMLDADGNG